MTAGGFPEAVGTRDSNSADHPAPKGEFAKDSGTSVVSGLGGGSILEPRRDLRSFPPENVARGGQGSWEGRAEILAEVGVSSLPTSRARGVAGD